MRLYLISTLLTVFLFANAFAAPTTKKTAATYNVRIELVDVNGNPYTGPTGLEGYRAINQATGVTYDGDQRSNLFSDLPAGTYSFGAYAGPWTGVVPKTVTLSDSQVGSDGYIVVTLVWWVE